MTSFVAVGSIYPCSNQSMTDIIACRKGYIYVRATKDYWQIKVDTIPKELHDLEVGCWNTGNAYEWKRAQSQDVGYESATKIYIDVYLPPDEVKEIRIKEKIEKAPEQLEGQMNLLDMFGKE